MNISLFASILASALYLVSGDYPLTSSDRLALRSYLREALLGDMGEAMAGPATRELESAANNKLIIPPNTFVSGGAGEGKQHLGASGKIPNKQVALPEVHPGYSNPPNPCPKTMDETEREAVKSEVHPRLMCYCTEEWQDKDTYDCTESDNCCLAEMPNTAAFVNQYQQSGEPHDQSFLPFKRNQYREGEKRVQLVAKKSPEVISKRSLGSRRPGTKRYNPYIDGQPLINSVVAKKSPGLSGLPAM